MHEFIHAFGFFHEHVRSDRNQYVRPIPENFKHYPNSQWKTQCHTKTFDVPYDGGSVMHYSPYQGSKGNPDFPTFESLIPDFDIEKFGQRKEMSEKDILKLKKMYNC